MVIKGTCQHEAQDRLHGLGNRVHNPTKAGAADCQYRCTVCKTEKTAPKSA